MKTTDYRQTEDEVGSVLSEEGAGDTRILDALAELNRIEPPRGLRRNLLAIADGTTRREYAPDDIDVTPGWWGSVVSGFGSWRYAFAASAAIAVCVALLAPLSLDQRSSSTRSAAVIFTDRDLEMIVVGMDDLDEVDVNEVI